MTIAMTAAPISGSIAARTNLLSFSACLAIAIAFLLMTASFKAVWSTRAWHRPKRLCKAPEEGCYIESPVADMPARCGRHGHILRAVMAVAHQDGAHALLVRDFKVSWCIFEHGGTDRIEAHRLTDQVIGLAVRFRDPVGLAYAPDGIETVQPPRFQNAQRIWGVGICVDDFQTGQGLDRGCQLRVGPQRAQVDVVNSVQKVIRIYVMFMHQTGQGGAVFVPVLVPQAAGAVVIQIKMMHHILAHPVGHLIEQPYFGRVKRIVEIEDPDIDIREILFIQLVHRQEVTMDASACNPRSARQGDGMKDAHSLILSAIESGTYRPGDRLVESELAERFGVSRTPIREALQRLETQSILIRDGRSLIVASLDHNQLAELYTVRAELEALAARLAARHATPEEVRVLHRMIRTDRKEMGDPQSLAQSNRRFHHQIHLASHNRYLVQQLDMLHRSMALMARTTLAAEGRAPLALDEHQAIVDAIAKGDGDAAAEALRSHISNAYETRLQQDAGVWDAEDSTADHATVKP